MPLHTVTWTIHIDADTPEQAAAEALDIQRTPNGAATNFVVTAPDGTRTAVDPTAVDLAAALGLTADGDLPVTDPPAELHRPAVIRIHFQGNAAYSPFYGLPDTYPTPAAAWAAAADYVPSYFPNGTPDGFGTHTDPDGDTWIVQPAPDERHTP